ncbi:MULTISPECIES: ribosomal protection-like ABC-F family protein [Paenibacillus]|uniref:ABC-F type ribosomal protection protein n=1 Tax=Paenibacillus macerans TaxID=44252 RepID=A0A090YA41_PAEMA|nr:ABC-F type ribosomal protection protein [Paenibacillus macerans]KFM94692.1 heme ABC exporter, ATP-binding protein CcmA [Paenibacillus macerans]MBS5912561.1 ABC-F type ribosomal protection protein [Paenibacillus macerans]MCY7558643.1 ABC-F type ribosomal protection protein [Paenibacillus macerans]MEC0152756.1 ABC-F type ribosomal protection protein [Paenibacillus macerans]MEC0332271.1 ABC-F type ribosomal protection protein [Paenibacillus macerans]
MMIQCQNIQKYYGAEMVLSDVTFEIKTGETVGLIGRNGTGKTTLMKLLTGKEQPDRGQLHIRKNARIGALAQIPDYQNGETVRGVLLEAFAGLRRVQAEMKQLENEMSAAGGHAETAGNMDSLLRRYGELQESFERGGGYEIDASIDRVAGGLGIPAEQFSRPFSSLSGGEKTKVGLAVILLQQPDLLLLDEPTNHLDMAAIEWLETYIRTFAGTVVIISHDRYFLDAVAEKIVELEDGEAFTYYGNYSTYKEEKERRLLQQFADYQEQQKKIKKMQETIKQLIEWGNRSNPPNPSFHRRAASMQKALDRMVKLKRPILERKKIGLQLQQADRSGNDAVVLQEVGCVRGARRLYSGLTHTLRYGEAAVLIGPNGTGKSTLLKNALGLEPPEEGEARLGTRIDAGYLAQQSAPADHEETVLQYFRDEIGIEAGEARHQLARFLFYGADVFKKVRSLSGGEWTRLRLAVLMHRKPNLLVLDEPTNHLDIDSREALEEALEEYAGTLLVVSHDRYFINKVASQIWALEGGRMHVTHGNYEDYREELSRRSAAAEVHIGGPAPAPSSSSASAAGVSPALSAQADAAERTKSADRADGTYEASASDGASRGASGGASGRASAEAVKAARKPRANPAYLRKLEADIAAAEAELAKIDNAMLDPETACDATRLIALQQERDALQGRLDEMMEEYFALLDESAE